MPQSCSPDVHDGGPGLEVLPPPIELRSCCSSRLPTVQPSLSLPTRSHFSARTLSKKTWQNGESPLISRIGRRPCLRRRRFSVAIQSSTSGSATMVVSLVSCMIRTARPRSQVSFSITLAAV